MKKVIKGKQIIIIGIISLLATGIILSSNWNYFLQNNDNNNRLVSSYQLNTNENIYTKYSQEESSIMFQINVLKSAISRNNIMYQQYNNVFKHNINYVRIQRNTIRNRINVANSSIKHEIDILNNMKNIVYNHPYNYLKFFQNKNYTLPQIVSQKQINHSYSLNNIKTYSQNINDSNTSVKNISYQSEEAAIGIGAITSIASASKTLIFSKLHFDYGSVYYFSSNLDNLSTNDQAKSNINLTNIQPTVASQNKFINYKKTDNTNLSNFDPFDPIKATSNLFNIYHFLKRNNLSLILGFAGGTISVIALGSIAAGVWRSSKKFSTNSNRVNVLIKNVFEAEGVERQMSLTSFNRQIVRHALKVERPNLRRATTQEISYNLNAYITYKKRTVIKQQIFDDMLLSVDVENVNTNLLGLKDGEKTTSNGWYKMPTFEVTEFNNLSNIQKDQIRNHISSLNELINAIPARNENGAIGTAMGRDIAAEIFNDYREVVSAHIGHLQTLLDTTATTAAVDSNKTFITEGIIRNYYQRFIHNTKLRKDDSTDISHISSIEEVLDNLGDIAEYGAP